VEARQAMLKRKCVKKYMDKEVPMGLVYWVLDCGRWAQTALGAQSWEFVVVKDNAARARLAEAAGQEWVAGAPVVVVVCSNLERVEFTIKEEGKALGMMEVSAAIQNMQVAARSRDLGSCAVFMFDRERARELVGAPERVMPIALLPLGYPKEFPENSRAPLGNSVHQEKFGQPPEGGVPEEFNRKWQRDSLIHTIT